ncbi:GNAT family N-acetyltransferase [Aestuariivirga sp.]|uniref:GNAT family N-acetyltransferase n=1 Tax=Aestuariivirga sp. TaxID=2650926 RepID=UPI003BAD8937
MTDIETSRLTLRTVPMAGLAATAAGDIEACRKLISPSLPEDWFEHSWVADLRLSQWKKDPAYGPWSIRAILLKDTGQVIGSINCHDMPHDICHGGETGLAIELGYTIFEPRRRQGLAFEAVRGLAEFARSQGVTWVQLSISPGNLPSQAMAQKMGAERIGSHMDEIDGPEDEYLVRL